MKEKRDRLFKRGRPVVRKIVLEVDGKPSIDVGIMWVAYKKGGFELFPKGMQENQFYEYIVELSKEVGMFMIDDYNKEYGDKMGPVSFVSIAYIGNKIEPHADSFHWATPRNILAGTVSLFQMIRYQKIGCSVTYALEKSKPLFDKVTEYGVLKYVGKIPNGDPHGRGDEYIYTIRGKK